MSDSKVRVRFAPSPTGALHIGGVRTALYNYLFAKQHKGDFILRIEDTDQGRYVPGAEDYIVRSLEWAGIHTDESPSQGGKYGPYRQSERMDIYHTYAHQLLENGFAYYAFDTPEELTAMREKDATFKYDASSRNTLQNSIVLSQKTVQEYLQAGKAFVIRMKVDAHQEIEIEDTIRGKVVFNSNEIDDKVILKGDGMPTYHLANIVDDHLMEITHVIRGEEWLPSTAHHVLLYRYFGWTPPEFAHLPLILKPTGQGKLSKRDGATFGFPVFPLQWNGGDEIFPGFREAGFLPEAVINFLGLMGWSPGTDEELFSMNEFISMFSLERIHKAGARFDFDKAKWFNQHYIIISEDTYLASLVKEGVTKMFGVNFDSDYIAQVCSLMKERVHLLPEIYTQGAFFFEEVRNYDLAAVLKKYKPENHVHLENMANLILSSGNAVEEVIKNYIHDKELKMGEIFPVLRIGISGTMQGPDLFKTIQVLGNQKASQRLLKAISLFQDESKKVS
ncbi:MAG: glutamate--tRNA ligase [Saprospiraceae bacterium]|nr:glutamate--tRNA ligase [Saprospiraceae bacterium]